MISDTKNIVDNQQIERVRKVGSARHVVTDQPIAWKRSLTRRCRYSSLVMGGYKKLYLSLNCVKFHLRSRSGLVVLA